MSRQLLSYDDANMRREHVGTKGVSVLKDAKKAVLDLDRTGAQGFLSLAWNTDALHASQSLAADIRKRCTDLIVLGIGGSDLGARTIHEALAVDGKGMRIHFAGSSTDPDQLLGILRKVDLKKSCVNVVSKSGGTLETTSAFLVLRAKLKKALGSAFAKHMVATTDPKSGALRELAEREGYHTLSIPGNVGGRFSVLSACGLFPAAAMGVNAAGLLEGARGIARAFEMETPETNAACRYAALHVAGMRKHGQRILVVMPYVSRLAGFARWTRQLIAESLGKRVNRRKEIVFEGITPVAAVGPEDQHSQLQLYAEGPLDKMLTFIAAGEVASDVVVPKAGDLPEVFRRPGGHRMSELLTLECEAVAEALRRGRRPNGTIHIDRLDAVSLGALFMFYELSVAVMGELLDVNAYDQPGVELAKKFVLERL